MKNKNMIIRALIVMMLWGSLFSSVKLGYKAFDISGTGDLLFFAGVRFTICGALICLFCFFKNKSDFSKLKPVMPSVIYTGIFAVILHYAFTYSALEMTESSALVSILKQVGMVFYICFSFLFFKEDRPTLIKFVAATIGFLGIIVINITDQGIKFGIGEVFVIAASFCSVFSNVFGKKAVTQANPFCVTGVSQLFGGIVLLIIGTLLGGSMNISAKPLSIIFVYICFASVSSYCLWYSVIKTGELSKLFIIKFAEPLFATMFGMILLSEPFKIQYLIGFVFIAISITLTKNKENTKSQ